ncbi:F-box/FBD/LRR-repeat protein At1g16930 [Linum grandiflorum]
MNNCCVCQLGQATKRARKEEEEDVDRLSYLPDSIIHHILSFLDADCAVRTSVLSRVWRCVWKHVPVLNFRRESFRRSRSFVRFVNKVLSNRYQLGVCKISFVDELASWTTSYQDMFRRVIRYAAFHGNRHLVLCLQKRYTFSHAFGSTVGFNLETLELRCMDIPSGFRSSSFQKLTTLNLERCILCTDQEGVFDLISNFPTLMNLVISDCEWDHFLISPSEDYSTKIIGPELRSLKLDRVSSNTEIVAPRLEFFNLDYCLEHGDIQGFSKLSIPSLHHADILVLKTYVRYFRRDKERMEYYFDSLLQGLHNAISLVIRSDNRQILKHISKYVGRNQSSFTRLKSFKAKKLPKVAAG